MNTYVTADLHMEHEPKGHMMRPFDLESWHEYILDRINSRVRRHDRLVIAGDFAFKRPGYWRQQISCKNVILVRGNHDNASKCERVFGGNFKESAWIKHQGLPFFVSHYPHAYYDGSHHGAYHLYGHCHGQREQTLDEIWPERRSMDVSPEASYRLRRTWDIWSMAEVYDHLSPYKGHDDVKFYEEIQEWKDFITDD